MADTGWVIAGTGSTDEQLGETDWTNPGNITADDGNNATVNVSDGAFSWMLVGTNFGFSIPVGATIDGVEVQIECTNDFAGDEVCFWDRAYIYKAGSIQLTSGKAPGDEFDGVLTAGGAADLWAQTLSPSDVNDSGFGCGNRPAADGEDVVAEVDRVSMKVYYTPAASSGGTERGTGRGVLRGVARGV